MFTGIIENTGKVYEIGDSRLKIMAPEIIPDLKKGSSVAVDGVCLTVVELSDETFTADFMPETATKSIIGTYQKSDAVNLELPLSADGRFEGHMVTGHVEETGEVADIQSDGNAYNLTIKIPTVLDRYVVPKGSIAVNGISLTVVDVKEGQFTVSIIPHTWEVTNLHTLKTGDKVNIETDVLAKHVEKLVTRAS